MKKVLFATTALIATAGVASADIAISGYAEMGVYGGDSIVAAGTVTQRETQFTQDADIRFNASGETDTGLSFGVSIDLDETASSVGNDDAGSTVFISGAFGTLTMGDTDGALDARTAEVPAGGGGLMDEQETLVWAANSGLDSEFDGQVVRLDLPTMNGVNISISHEQDAAANGTATVGGEGGIWGVGASFAVGTINVGLGYQSGEITATTDADATAISLGTTAGAVSYGLMYVSEDRDGWAKSEDMLMGGVTFTSGAWTMGGSYGTLENSGGNVNRDINSLALTAAYNLGGGATFHLGYADNEVDNAGTKTDASSWSAGVAMSF